MNGLKLIPLVASIVIIVAGCAGTTTTLPQGDAATVVSERFNQQVAFAQEYRRKGERLEVLARQVLDANVELCPRTAPYDGFVVETEYVKGMTSPEIMKALYGRDLDRPLVTRVTAGSPAARAGLKQGDAIVKMNDWYVPALGSSRSRRTVQRALVSKFRDMGFEPSTYTVLRGTDGPDGEQTHVDITITPTRTCDYWARVVPGDQLNAWTDGTWMYFSFGIMRFLQNDKDLQAVVAHELAHITEGHVEKSSRNATVGGLIGLIVDVAAATQGISTGMTNRGVRAGALMHSKDFEREADYVSIYMLSRAGIDTSEVSDLWRKMAAETGSAGELSRTHPSSAERYVNLHKAHKEAAQRAVQGQPMLPNRRK